MNYEKAHREFNQLVVLENTSTVEPTVFEKYFNLAQEEFVEMNYGYGTDSRIETISSIQHLRIIHNGSMKWKNNFLQPLKPETDRSVIYSNEWGGEYRSIVSGVTEEAPKLMKHESIMARIEYGDDDPCKRTGLSRYLQAFYLRGGRRNYIGSSTLRGVSNKRPYFYYANNRMYFELFGNSVLNDVILEYYRYPVDIAFNSGIDNYQNPDHADYPNYAPSAPAISPELSDVDTRKVLRLATAKYLEAVQSRRVQTFQ